MRKGLVACLGLAALFVLPALFFSASKPRYAWLILGQKARLRVLVCLDGAALCLDYFVDGEPTGRQEWYPSGLCRNVLIPDPDGSTSYLITGMAGSIFQHGVPTRLVANIEVKGPLEYTQYGEIAELNGDPEKAPQAHFHGPLTVEAQTIQWNLPAGLALRRGEEPTDLRVWVTTSDPDRRWWVLVLSGDDQDQSFGGSVYPFADVEFPANNPGDPPIKRRYPLNQFC